MLFSDYTREQNIFHLSHQSDTSVKDEAAFKSPNTSRPSGQEVWLSVSRHDHRALESGTRCFSLTCLWIKVFHSHLCVHSHALVSRFDFRHLVNAFHSPQYQKHPKSSLNSATCTFPVRLHLPVLMSDWRTQRQSWHVTLSVQMCEIHTNEMKLHQWIQPKHEILSNILKCVHVSLWNDLQCVLTTRNWGILFANV